MEVVGGIFFGKKELHQKKFSQIRPYLFLQRLFFDYAAHPSSR